MYLSTKKEELPVTFAKVEEDPYQGYIDALLTPAPTTEIESVTAQISRLYTIPGWLPTNIDYASGALRANVKSSGTKMNVLFKWVEMNNAKLLIASDGVYVTLPVSVTNRPRTTAISSLQQVIAELIDRISTVNPGNNLTLAPIVNKGSFFETQLSINFGGLTLEMLNLLAEQLKGLPVVLVKMTISINNGTLSGVLVLKALGS